MQPEWQVRRNDLFWLIASFIAVVALHFEELPVWIIGLFAAVIIWRILHYRARLELPRWPVKLGFVLACSAGIILQYGTLIGLEPMLALLCGGTALKFIEMYTKRDAFIIICAGYFITSVACIFSQSLLTFLPVLACMLILTANLVAIHQSHLAPLNLRPLKLASLALLTSLPLMLVLFLIMPRLGALWALPGPKNHAITGVSSTMSPGDFTKLGRSAELAFRVKFDGKIPDQNQLYWRGLVLSHFDGRTWSQSSFSGDLALLGNDAAQQALQKMDRLGRPVNYSVTLQPTYNRWLFVLAAVDIPQQENVYLTRDYGLVSRNEVHSRFQYQVKSWLEYRLEPVLLDHYQRAVSLRLPKGFNPQTVKIARQWTQETPTPEALIERVLKLYNQSFTYSLEPNPLGKHSVDEFLWNTRRGFCEHFASSFVVFMRAAGYPARVVAGYQGGEVHPSGEFLTVRQYDAHAWAEVWLPGRGWIRADPTAAVAPERIEQSFTDYFEDQPGFLDDTPFSLAKYRRFGMMNWLRLKIDSLDYAWATWVLGYQNQQQNVMEKLLGKVTAVRLALFLFAGALITLLPLLIIWMFRFKRISRDPLDKIYLQFCHKAEVAGFPRQVGEGAYDFAQRLTKAFPQSERFIFEINTYYINHRYGGMDKKNHPAFKRAIHRLSLGKSAS